MALTKPYSISRYAGTASTVMPANDTSQTVFLPTRSESAPTNGRHTIIANCPMIGTHSDWVSVSWIVTSRYAGMYASNV